MKFKNLHELQKHFCNELVCAQYLEQQRWGGKPLCPHCGSEEHYRTKTRLRHPDLKDYKDFLCKACGKKYTVLTGSIYEGTKVRLQTWMLAQYILSNHKKGISSPQLAADLGVTQTTAWFIMHRIREVFKEAGLVEKFTGVTQIDECFVGGKNKNRHKTKRIKYKREHGNRNFQDKTPVMGLLNDGKVRLFVVPDVKYYTLRRIIRHNIQLHSTIVSDDWVAYQTLWKKFDHQIVKHMSGKYVNSEGYTTNGIEGFWAIFKRGIFGIYHYVSRKHLQRYCEEFAFRFNHRMLTVIERFEETVKRCGNARLLYKVLTG